MQAGVHRQRRRGLLSRIARMLAIRRGRVRPSSEVASKRTLDMVRLASGRKLSTSLRPSTTPIPASFRASAPVRRSAAGPAPRGFACVTDTPVRQISHRRDIQDITGRGEICIIRIAGQPTRVPTRRGVPLHPSILDRSRSLEC